MDKKRIRLEFEILNCRLERLNYKKQFYESELKLALEKLSLNQNFEEKQKKYYAVENAVLTEIYKNSFDESAFEKLKQNLQEIEGAIKKSKDNQRPILKDIENYKQILKECEEELKSAQKQREDF